MPPKSPKGKKKLSKAEKEKLKKEEAELKAKEEEEARLLAEEEAAAQKERDKLEAEERRRLENEERKRRKGQLEELESIWESNRSTLQTENAERRKKSKWDRYMLCDGSPDPTVPGEINTFINLWREDMDNNDINSVLHDSKLALKLIDELQFLLDDTPSDEITEQEVNQYKNTMSDLQQLLQEKLDLASHHLLLQASSKPDPETANLQQVISEDNITLCMWGNLSKNPRIKTHEFPENGFGFEMPKLLSLSDCTFRGLFLKYDHFSQYSKSYYCRIKYKETVAPEEEVAKPEEEGQKEGEELEEKQGEEGQEPVSREETKDVMAALRQLDDEEEEKKEEEEVEKQDEEPLEEDYEIKTPEPEEFEEFDGDEDTIDLRAYQVLGGIFHFNLLQLPPQPKHVNNWTISKVVKPQLQPLDYAVEVNPVSAAPSPAKDVKDGPSPNGEDKKEKKEIERPPIGVILRLPESAYFFEEPQVGLWDAESKQWRIDCFSDHKFDEETKVLTFKTSQFGPMALIQDSHINMPYQSWEIRPRATNQAVMTIIAAIVEVEIQIKDGLCSLSQPEDKSELAHIINKWFPPQEFMKVMKHAGVNLFPQTDSSKYVSIQSKNPLTEERLYQQMALTSSSMAYSWSKWNSEVNDSDRIVIQGCEQLNDEPLLEEDWSLFMINKKRTTKLKMTEFDEAFSEDHAEGTEFHADLYHMSMEISSDAATDRIRETSHQFIDAVYQILKSTRIITYS